MTDDHPGRVDALDDRLYSEPVEPEPRTRVQLGGERVAARLLRDGPVEGGIGDGDVRDAGERRAGTAERVERGPVVERGDRRALFDVGEDPVVDDGGVDRGAAEMDDPVADCVRGGEVVDRRRRLSLDGRELQAGRAGVDDKDAAQNGQTQSCTSG